MRARGVGVTAGRGGAARLQPFELEDEVNERVLVVVVLPHPLQREDGHREHRGEPRRVQHPRERVARVVPAEDEQAERAEASAHAREQPLRGERVEARRDGEISRADEARRAHAHLDHSIA